MKGLGFSLTFYVFYVVIYFNFNAEIYYFLHVTSWAIVTLWQLICVLQADQICYAVLCVFSYVAAGHKKQRRPGPSAHAHVSHTPTSGSVSPRGPRYSSHQWWMMVTANVISFFTYPMLWKHQSVIWFILRMYLLKCYTMESSIITSYIYLTYHVSIIQVSNVIFILFVTLYF